MKTTLRSHNESIRLLLSKIENGTVKLPIKLGDYPDELSKAIVAVNLLLFYLEVLDFTKEPPLVEQNETDTLALGPKEKETILAEKLMDYVTDNQRRPLPTIKEIADKFSTNTQKLKIAFKTAYGTTMFKYHTQLRLEAAYREIERDRYETLVNIALKFGYTTYHSFHNSFKKQFGHNPESLRKVRTGNKNK